MKKTALGIFIIAFLCSFSNNVKISVESRVSLQDTIIIKDLITQKVIYAFPADKKTLEFTISEPTVVSLVSQNNPQKNPLIAILYNGKNFGIQLKSKDVFSSTNVADSLLGYLFLSNNTFIQKNSRQIFSSNNTLAVATLFSRFLVERDSVINSYSSTLTPVETDVLKFQNHARIYSFLFYYGRLIKKIEPQNEFWSFIDKIDNNNAINKSLPHNLLYKYEIAYLLKYNTVESIKDFIAFIQKNTSNKDLAEYLKAIYISELLYSPDYWQKHYKIFNADTLHAIIQEDVNNPYNYIYSETAENYYASQHGMTAYNFTGLDLNNNPIKLSDFSGKYVLIDVWATWCGACIAQKPIFTEIASKYKNNNDISFVAISIDSDTLAWRKYLTNHENTGNIIELNIKNGKNTDFGANYAINFIPKYILIDKDGKIIDANIQNPSIKLEMILKKLITNE